jgi:hypothetical protein
MQINRAVGLPRTVLIWLIACPRKRTHRRRLRAGPIFERVESDLIRRLALP